MIKLSILKSPTSVTVIELWLSKRIEVIECPQLHMTPASLHLPQVSSLTVESIPFSLQTTELVNNENMMHNTSHKPVFPALIMQISSVSTAKAPVTYLDIAHVVDKQVLWLQVSVDEVQVVQVLECQHYLRRVEPRMRLAVGTRRTHAR